jgi:hypothetical protein
MSESYRRRESLVRPAGRSHLTPNPSPISERGAEPVETYYDPMNRGARDCFASG